jgi:hypothetical protein
MNTTTTLAAVAIVSALALVIAPSLMASASAAPNTVCVKSTGGGTVSPPGQDQPNTPPGKADCPKPFKAKNENAVK